MPLCYIKRINARNILEIYWKALNFLKRGDTFRPGEISVAPPSAFFFKIPSQFLRNEEEFYFFKFTHITSTILRKICIQGKPGKRLIIFYGSAST